MDFSAILINCLWVGLFAAGMGILLTAPLKYIFPAFVCGFTGRLVLNLMMKYGASQNSSIVVATFSIVLIAGVILNREKVSPVVLITAILPLGATVAMLNTIIELMKVSSLKGELLNASSIALTANLGKAFTITLAIALGLAAGIGFINLFAKRKENHEGQ